MTYPSRCDLCGYMWVAPEPPTVCALEGCGSTNLSISHEP